MPKYWKNGNMNQREALSGLENITFHIVPNQIQGKMYSWRKKIMKNRSFAILLVICIIIGITGCGAKRESAETVVGKALDAAKEYDTEAISKYWENDDLGSDSDDELGEETVKAILGGITYEIVDSKETEDTATVEVKISNVDMSNILTQAVADVFPTLLAEAFKPQAEQMTEEESNKLFSDKLTELLQRSDNQQVTKTVTVELTLQDDAWVISGENDDAFDAMLGGVHSFAEAMAQAFSGDVGGDSSKNVAKTTP
ncbi:MAG: hypothetical protein VB078_04810 [Clostridiaceae bacterium]|nr:hypothetical protein [Clostridiaceae bacterium]